MSYARRDRRFFLCLLLLGMPALAFAQAGRISGTVTGFGGTPLVGAHVLLPTVGLAAQSGEGGTFTITGVPAGTYDVKVFRVGYRPSSRAGVMVAAGADTKVAIALDRAEVLLQSVVVTASRHAEKITDAAATITVIGAEALDGRVGNSYALALRNVPGLDVTQVGITSVFVNGRGFNNRFNTRWLKPLFSCTREPPSR